MPSLLTMGLVGCGLGGFRCRLRGLLCLVFVGELLPDLFGDRVSIHLVDGGCVSEYSARIPYLKQLGVSQQAIHTMTVENPKRIFGRS